MLPTSLARLLFCLVLIGLLSACGGGGEEADSPEAIVKTFYKHLNSGSDNAAKALYTTESRKMFDDPEMASDNAFEDWVASETKQGSISEVKILGSSGDEQSAEISFEIHYKDGSNAARKVSMVKENGAWKLELIQVAG